MKNKLLNKDLVVLLGALLFIAILPMPYTYYIFLRWSVFIGTSFLFINSLKNIKKASLLLIIIILFNPLIPIYLSKQVWIVIDIFSGLFLMSLSKRIE